MHAQLPKITIVTPSFNQGPFIEQTIRSVLDQDYPNLEFLVFDGGSTDETVSILQRYGDQITWVSERDGGQSDALNKGFRAATGDVVAFINTDDVYEPGALHAVGRHFAENPDSVWLTGKCRNIDQGGLEIRRTITAYKNFWLRTRSLAVLKVLNYISQPSTFWRRHVLEEVGLMNEELHYAMDYDYWLRMATRYRLDFLDRYLARFRIHATSKAGASASAQFDAGYEIAAVHVDSRFLLGLHRWHDLLTVGVYRRLMARDAA